MTTIAKFEVGATYSCTSICDSECVFRFTVEKRTEKTVWLNYHGKIRARRVRIHGAAECCDPLGQFSMSPVLFATDGEAVKAAA